MRQYDSIRQDISLGRNCDRVDVGKRRARAGGGEARPLAHSSCGQRVTRIKMYQRKTTYFKIQETRGGPGQAVRRARPDELASCKALGNRLRQGF